MLHPYVAAPCHAEIRRVCNSLHTRSFSHSRTSDATAWARIPSRCTSIGIGTHPTCLKTWRALRPGGVLGLGLWFGLFNFDFSVPVVGCGKPHPQSGARRLKPHALMPLCSYALCSLLCRLDICCLIFDIFMVPARPSVVSPCPRAAAQTPRPPPSAAAPH